VKYAVGIDLGSTTTKAVVLDEDGHVLGRGITNSRSNYDLAAAVARIEGFINARFGLIQQQLESTGSADSVGRLRRAFVMEQLLLQLRRLEQLLLELNIAHLHQATALSLSGGERRRVEIARALATRPSFILLDEPFAGVDPIAVLDIQRIIRFLKERSIGILITDHNVRETLGICDRAYIINDGSVLASGVPDEIVYNEHVRRVYLGEHFRL